ncbi:CcdB family protein [Rhizobium sp. RU36D]|uniref:CcdB family protein n=1 Tax=Rhizobium sp. RU36D TaxID=1907415 RepID=UPI0009D8709B|nr:CcdB family protein [Rhizobium sp. RU36D]SMD09653.1 toxin CcdB [Rhizobium sp. RU36D]
MARFWAYRVGDDGFAVDLQSNLLDGLHTRVVAPLVPLRTIVRIAPRLNPRFQIEGETYVMLTEFISTIPTAEIGPVIADLSRHADEITAATDFLFQGF